MNSLYNTPPSWALYITGLVFKWIRDNGGVEGKTTQLVVHLILPFTVAMTSRSSIKSQMVLDVLASSDGFYTNPVQQGYRSRMNVPCRIAGGNEQLEAEFLKEADKRGLLSLKGHRSVGGLRISLYNAISPEEVEKLVVYMKEFMADNKK